MEINNGNNRVNLCGNINGLLEYSHSLYGEAFFSFMLDVPRLSGAMDVLPITVSEKLIAKCNLHDGACVSLQGQLRSYNKCIDGINRLILTVFAQNIENGGASHNEIVLNGFICKLPVYRMTPFNREIADILLAVNRAYNKSDYIPCIAWGRNARYAQSLCVGCKVEASGRIQSREYQKVLDSGVSTARTAYEVSLSLLEVR